MLQLAPPRRVQLALRAFFAEQVELAPDEPLLVAFSGGPDSTALLAALAGLRDRLGIVVEAAHLDHGLDHDSSRRAEAARALSRTLGVPFHLDRLALDPRRIAPAGGLEAAARAERYRFLHRQRRRIGARYLVTAHHRDDQVETVLLRLLGGSGLRGLAAMSRIQGPVLRPLLSLSRVELQWSLEGTGLVPVEDPTNDWQGTGRNRVRTRLVPRLRERHPDIESSLLGLAESTRTAMETVDRRLEDWLEPHPVPPIPGLSDGILVDRRSLERLPPGLLPLALGLLHRRAGAPHPATAGARRELERQMSRSAGVGCDAGGGWRWERSGPWYSLRKKPRPAGVFSYTCPVPGSLFVPELGFGVHVEHLGQGGREIPSNLPEWTAILSSCGEPTTDLRIRNRLPGDRIRPFPSRGEPGSPSLNEVLARAGVPPSCRDCVPLLCIGDRVAWIPGLPRPGGSSDEDREASPDDGPHSLRVRIVAPEGEPEAVTVVAGSEDTVITLSR